MKKDAKEVRTYMTGVSSRQGNPFGMGTLESFLAPSEILALVDQFPPKHSQFLLGLDINVVVNTNAIN
ncbi:MAG TPA: hypothetical protein VNN20_10140 [Thermodesulfobacteriota bacterium]|nr:hypothetical protein [Thermodesulfobacteriota bacterium]